MVTVTIGDNVGLCGDTIAKPATIERLTRYSEWVHFQGMVLVARSFHNFLLPAILLSVSPSAALPLPYTNTQTRAHMVQNYVTVKNRQH